VKHYHGRAWLLYRQNRIGEEERRLMEEHLASCDLCLQRYLDAGTEQDALLAELLLPPDFSDRVKEMIRSRRWQAYKKQRSRSLANYAVAAAITLVLMSSGIFDLCARELPGILAETGQIPRAIEKTVQWDAGRLLENARTQLEKLRQSKEE
jgi:anti-sigma factor RsiW